MNDLHMDDTRSEALAARLRLRDGLSVAERVLEIAGVSTTVWEGGGGPPIVLLHGQGASAAAWLPVIPNLLATHRLVIPDLPGLGESINHDGDLDAAHLIDWLGGLISETCSQPPTVVGLSLGGTVAAHFAVGRGHECRQVALVDSGSLGPFRPDPRLLPALIRSTIRPTEPNIERLFRHTVTDLARFKSLLGGKWGDFIAYGRERAATATVQAANRHMLRRLGTKQIPDADLRGIEAPVALIWGRHDRVMKLGIAESASEKFGWPLHVIDDAGHVSCWDQPDVFAQTIRAVTGAQHNN